MTEKARIAIGIEYNGSSFHGWQQQPDRDTVQGAIETAVSEIACHPVSVVAAGRTDAGVHALQQVAHFDTTADRPQQAWIRGVNSQLPKSIAIRWARPVDVDFHSRFAAVARSYRYVIFNNPVRPALQHSRVGWFHRRLDIDAINAGLSNLTGEHDFSTFRSSECQAKSPVKTLHEAVATRHADYVVLDFRGSGFLHHMVRNIIGSMLWVGQGKMPPEWIGMLLAARDRTIAAPTIAPDGLYFVGAEYDTRWNLPQQASIMAAFDPLRL